MPIRYIEKQHVSDSSVLSAVSSRDGAGSSIDADSVGTIHGSNLATDTAIAMALAGTSYYRYPNSDISLSLSKKDPATFQNDGVLKINLNITYPYTLDDILMVEWRWMYSNRTHFNYYKTTSKCLEFTVPNSNTIPDIRVWARVYFKSFVTDWTNEIMYTLSSGNIVPNTFPTIESTKTYIGNKYKVTFGESGYDTNNVAKITFYWKDYSGNVVMITESSGVGDMEVPSIRNDMRLPTGIYDVDVEIKYNTTGNPVMITFDTRLELTDRTDSRNEIVSLRNMNDNMGGLISNDAVHNQMCTFTKDKIFVAIGATSRTNSESPNIGNMLIYDRKTQEISARELNKWSPALTGFVKRSNGQICMAHGSNYTLRDILFVSTPGTPYIISDINSQGYVSRFYQGFDVQRDNENNVWVLGNDNQVSPKEFKVFKLGADGTTAKKFTYVFDQSEPRGGCVGTIDANGDLIFMDVVNKQLRIAVKADLNAGNNNSSLLSSLNYYRSDYDTYYNINKDIHGYAMTTMYDGRVVMVKPHIIKMGYIGHDYPGDMDSGVTMALFVLDYNLGEFKFSKLLNLSASVLLDYNNINPFYLRQNIYIKPLEDNTLAITGGYTSKVTSDTNKSGSVSSGCNRNITIVTV